MTNTIASRPCPTCGHLIAAEAPQGLCPHCVLLLAACPTESDTPDMVTQDIPTLTRVSAAFPQLEILEWIGRGGMGVVYKARQRQLGRLVALKVLPERLSLNVLFAERFHREGQVLARLSHPNIVNVHDFGTSGGFCYLLMEYVDGVNLRQAMKAGRFSPTEALSIVPKICDALQYAHTQGVLHRDIKPENILLDERGGVKIADFGIAKLLGDDSGNVTLTRTGGALGTPHYMAPEQFEQPGLVDHRADIYSLGVVFYEMLTGELPLGRFAPPSEKTPVGQAVDDLVFRTLEKERSRRFQSAGEMRESLATLPASGLPPQANEPVMPAKRRESRPVLWAMAGVAFFTVAVLAILLGIWVFSAVTGRPGAQVLVKAPESAPQPAASRLPVLGPIRTVKLERMSPRLGEVSASTRLYLPAGESLIARVEYPDGRVEEFPQMVYGVRSDRRRYVSRTLRWHLPSLSSNQTHEIVKLWRDHVEGNAFPLSREQFQPVFRATNQAGGVSVGSIGLRWNTEVTDPERAPLLLKLTAARSLSGMILTSLRWDGPVTCLPEGVGLLDGVEEVETHTVLHGSGGGSDSCRWNLPPTFGEREAGEIVRQLLVLVDSGSRLPLPLGGTMPVFSVTNSLGHVFSGQFILPSGEKATP